MAPTRKRSSTLAAVVLAAGKGKRMRSPRPKVLQAVCGRPSLWHVLRSARGARPDAIVVVVHEGGEQVEQAVRSWGIKPEPVFVDQGDPLGTGQAVLMAEEAVAGVDDVLAMAGDQPLVSEDQVRSLVRTHRRTRAGATIMTTWLEDPKGYGRVIRDGDRLSHIAEEADATADVKKIREVAVLVYAFHREDLFKALPLVGRENRQHEFYLQDVFPILQDKGEHVSVVAVDLSGSVGINSRKELADAERIMRGRIVEAHMANGVTFVDPSSSYLDVDVRIGADTVILPTTFLEGSTKIGARCSIGPSTRVVDSTVGDDAEVSFSVVRQSKIGRGATVGPYANLRPGTVLEQKAKAGSFVEIKASRIGRGAKVPHLSYVGDAKVGAGANIGAATVTVNYDGFEKHRTEIGEDAHIGSDTMLVAPVKVGKGAFTGAGSVITRDVPAGSLAVERSEQRVVPGYAARKRAKHEAKSRRRSTGTNDARGEGKP
ncbi:MAG TPA: bifunctional UDP-N-acetylglucosamine diphosphorylase/glucosamine-1-phosphate N-acetyltransferase GlmU [Actinomycetota bacterium]